MPEHGRPAWILHLHRTPRRLGRREKNRALQGWLSRSQTLNNDLHQGRYSSRGRVRLDAATPATTQVLYSFTPRSGRRLGSN